MPVTPRGADTAAALRKWIFDEIADAPKRIFEIGKVLFGVSSGSIGVFVTVSKFSENLWNWMDWLALGLFALSVAVGLMICMPRLHKLSATFDIAAAHSEYVTNTWRLILLWGIVWTLGVILASMGLLWT